MSAEVAPDGLNKCTLLRSVIGVSKSIDGSKSCSYNRVKIGYAIRSQSKMSSFFLRRSKCPVCGSERFVSLYCRSYNDPKMRQYMDLAYQGNVEYRHLVGVKYEVTKCTNCGLVFQPNVLNDLGSQRLYDVWIDPHLAKLWHRQSMHRASFVFSQRLSFIANYCGTTDVTLVDYGAGFGQFCLMAKGFGFDVVAVEFSEDRLEYLRQLGINSVLPKDLKEKWYKFVNINHVLEHVADPAQILKSVRSILLDDGVLFVAVPNCKGLEKRLAKVDKCPMEQFVDALRQVSALQHINCFTYSTLHLLCNKVGFDVLNTPLSYTSYTGSGTSIKEVLKILFRVATRRVRTELFLKKKSQFQ